LKSFLSVFAAIEGPQQLVHHKLLERIFLSFLAHHDTEIVELAVSCLVKYKISCLVRYKLIISSLLQQGKIRNALLDLAEDVNSRRIDIETRTSLIPIISRVLFGRLSARAGKASSKDSPRARRAAVLSFLSALCHDDVDFFPLLYLMTRPFIPQNIELTTIETFDSEGRNRVMRSLMTTRCDEIASSGRVIEGFLHLLESVVTHLGYRVVAWVPQLTFITIEICNIVAVNARFQPTSTLSLKATAKQNNEGGLRRGVIRTLCFQRLSECLSRFASAVDFYQFSRRLWDALDPSLQLLPEMVVRSQGCPALLTLLRTMSEQDTLIDLLIANDKAVGAVVECIAETSTYSVIHSSLALIENLLSATDRNMGQNLVRKYATKIVGQFAKRFSGGEHGKVVELSTGYTSKRSGSPSPTFRRELELLCNVSQFAADECVDGSADDFSPSLCSILVPYLFPDQGISDEDKMNVLGILSTICSHLDEATSYIVFNNLSGSLAPTKSREGITSLSVRQGIAKLMDRIAEKVPRLQPISSLLVKISSSDKKRIEEIDFDVAIPGLISLTNQEGESAWKCLSIGEELFPLDFIPLVNCCFHFLYNEDGVISRASYNGLRELVITSANESKESQHDGDGWTKLVESAIVPLARRGLECRNVQVRRYCILLVREVAKWFRQDTSSHVCSDLWRFCDEENPDLDFFLGITHVQMHRRARAFRRLRKTLTQADESLTSPALSSESLVSVLVPLTLHPLYESKTNSEESLALEAIATLGVLARELSWSKYNKILWSLLSQFDRQPNQERYLVGGLCAMIESFHFELLTAEDSNDPQTPQTKTSVWRSLENRIIPRMEGLLTKESKDKNGNRINSLRPTIMLALTKLFLKFPEDFLESKLSKVLAVTCDVLRSKDSNSRDVARTTLAKLVCSLDIKYLGDVIRELAITLTEGYKLHVRAAAIHTILLELTKVYDAPAKLTMDCTSPLLDNFVPALMDVLQDDLFGEANERRESQETNVRFVKEASGNKSFHSIEMLSKMIVFSPSDTTVGNLPVSSVHCIVSPFLERLRQPDVDTRTIRTIKEVLSRIVVGISNNNSVVGEELLPFIYATTLPFVGQEAIASIKQGTGTGDDTDVDDVDADEALSIKVSGTTVSELKTEPTKRRTTGCVVTWQPSTLQSALSGKTAVGMRNNTQQQLRKVQDGFSAPKLTGKSRHGFMSFDNITLNEPATVSAVTFSLNLLSSCQRKKGILGSNVLPMLDPFIPMLTALVCYCRDTEITLLALKSLQGLLRFDLPSVACCSKTLGTRVLQLLSSSASSSSQSYLIQACFKTLTFLISNDADIDKGKSVVDSTRPSEQVLIAHSRMPLDSEQLKVLCSLLQISIVDTEQHNPALNLIKAMMSHRYMSPEFYDLLEAILKLTVRSPKPTLRQVRSFCGYVHVISLH
jgi:U3 small nucleolar RNA-associated protein 20